MPSKRERKEQGMATSRQTVLPTSSPTYKYMCIKVVVMGPGFGPSQGGYEIEQMVALSSDELDMEWRAVMEKQKERIDTA